VVGILVGAVIIIGIKWQNYYTLYDSRQAAVSGRQAAWSTADRREKCLKINGNCSDLLKIIQK